MRFITVTRFERTTKLTKKVQICQIPYHDAKAHWEPGLANRLLKTRPLVH